MRIILFLTTNVNKMWYWELENAERFYTEVTAFELTENLHKRNGGRHAIDAVDIMSGMH